ncbi:4274_t:CDS:2, partial [Dentiscutata heterogama]
GAFFHPGDTLPVLKKQLDEIKDTTYCFDNESFRFLAAHIINCTPHKIIVTISLNNARQIVMILYKPLAEVIPNVQENIAQIEKLKKEIQSSDITAEGLKNKLICKKSVVDNTIGSCHVKWKMLNAFMQK